MTPLTAKNRRVMRQFRESTRNRKQGIHVFFRDSRNYRAGLPSGAGWKGRSLMSEYVLRALNVKKHFGGVKALKDVSLEIKKGEVHCLAGENGCGKSTLIKVISGFYTPDGGTVEFDGVPCPKVTPSVAIAAGVQVIYQDFSIFPNLTVMENLAINKELMRTSKLINWKRMRETAIEAVSKIGFKVDLDEKVENLSVADKQLIAISRALLNNAKLIIMDEPTTALTKKEVKALFEIIRSLQAQGIAILFVSHKLDEVFEICERFTILRSGENVAAGNTSELDDKKFSYYMTGREFDSNSRPAPCTSEETVLEVKNLSLHNGFKDVSFKLRKGEILGITGLLGSGRTELVQAIFGYTPADEGEIYVNGQKAQIRCVRDAIRYKIGYVPEDRLTEGLFLIQSISRNITVTKLDEYSNRMGVVDQKQADAEVEKWIKELSVATNNAVRPVQTLSGGNQQKVVLARWLANDLDVLILNGPTVGVDIGAKYDIHALIHKLAEIGLAVIIVSDDLPEVLDNCHRVLIMRAGRIVGEAGAEETTAQQLAEMSMQV